MRRESLLAISDIDNLYKNLKQSHFLFPKVQNISKIDVVIRTIILCRLQFFPRFLSMECYKKIIK